MPRRKRFQYDTLLRIRRRQEDLKAEALAAARRRVGAAERQRTELAQQQRRTLEEAGQAARRRFDAADVRRYYQYERHLAGLTVELDARIAELRNNAETRRDELEEAMKDRRIVEKLKERRDKMFLQKALKDEQRQSDESAVNQAAARRAAERSA